MDPESVELRDLEGLRGGAGERVRSPFAHVADGDDGDLQRGQLGPVVLELVADPEEPDVLVPQVGPQTLQVGQVRLPAPGGESELLTAGGTDTLGVAGVPEVRGGSPTTLKAWGTPTTIRCSRRAPASL